MSIFHILAFSWPFMAFGIIIIGRGFALLGKKDDEARTTARRAGSAKDLVEDATDKELIYDYVVRGKIYHLIVTPGDKVEDYLNVIYNRDDPNNARIYYKETETNLVEIFVCGVIFAFVGVFCLVIGLIIQKYG